MPCPRLPQTPLPHPRQMCFRAGGHAYGMAGTHRRGYGIGHGHTSCDCTDGSHGEACTPTCLASFGPVRPSFLSFCPSQISIHPSVRPSVRPSIHSFVHLSTHPCVRPPVCVRVRMRSSIRAPPRACVRVCVCAPVCPSRPFFPSTRPALPSGRPSHPFVIPPPACPCVCKGQRAMHRAAHGRLWVRDKLTNASRPYLKQVSPHRKPQVPHRCVAE